MRVEDRRSRWTALLWRLLSWVVAVARANVVGPYWPPFHPWRPR